MQSGQIAGVIGYSSMFLCNSLISEIPFFSIAADNIYSYALSQNFVNRIQIDEINDIRGSKVSNDTIQKGFEMQNNFWSFIR